MKQVLLVQCAWWAVMVAAILAVSVLAHSFAAAVIVFMATWLSFGLGACVVHARAREVHGREAALAFERSLYPKEIEVTEDKNP